MGSKHSSGKAEIKENKIIHQNCDLPDDKPKEVEESIKNRILLLGTGDSGKSTLRQKINALCNDDYGSGYLEDFCRLVRAVINDGMPVLIKLSGLPSDNEAVSQFNAAYGIAHQKVLTQGMMAPESTSEYFFACANSIKTLWADPAVQQAYHKSLEDPYNKVFPRIEAHYFLDRIEEISKPEYLPNEQDMLKVRVRTTGILTEVNTFNNSKFELIDIGGAQSERKKWKHTYEENVAALIFVAALDCFDMPLYENDKDNCLVDSLICFDEVLGSQYPRGQYPCFEKSSMILLLTKRDLFEKKIRENKLSQSPAFKDKPVDYFDAFEGGTIDNYENGIEAIKAEFQQRFTARMGERELRIYVTCATELDHLRSVWEDIWSGLTLSE
jgi:GTPase SAR1 family protein